MKKHRFRLTLLLCAMYMVCLDVFCISRFDFTAVEPELIIIYLQFSRVRSKHHVQMRSSFLTVESRHEPLTRL